MVSNGARAFLVNCVLTGEAQLTMRGSGLNSSSSDEVIAAVVCYFEEALALSRDRSSMFLFECPPRYTLSVQDLRRVLSNRS